MRAIVANYDCKIHTHFICDCTIAKDRKPKFPGGYTLLMYSIGNVFTVQVLVI